MSHLVDMFADVYSREELCLTFVPDRSVWDERYFRDEKRTEARSEAALLEGS